MKKKKKKISKPSLDTKKSTVESIKARRAYKRRQSRKWMIIGGVATLLSGVTWALFIPYKGPITYGACKVFLENYVLYPQSVRISTVDDYGASVRIWFTYLDSFGEFKLEPMQCFFKMTTDDDKKKYGNVSFIMEKATINRREIGPDIIERFNYSILGIVASPPDLSLPTPIPDSLEDLQVDSSKFRKPIFDK
ncbi:MAG TPA: hypothetical protein DEA55_06255 [Rhodospirillaceae bacterium]|nr:hypothetical protein [Rhodospirillaceae bacterium]